jgi:hypothetical protein
VETIELDKCCKCGGPTKVEVTKFGLKLRVCVDVRCGGNAIVQAKSARRKREPGSSTVQHKLPGLDPGVSTTLIKIREEDNQRDTMAGFCRMGWLVLQTTVRYKMQKCPECHTWHRPEGGYGSTPGVPDLLVRNPAWWPALWFGLEIKGTDTPLSPAQIDLRRDGHIRVSRAPSQSFFLASVFDYCLSLEV